MSSSPPAVSVGALAPTFIAKSTQREVNLAQYQGRQNIVLYFMRALSCVLCQRHVTQLKEMNGELQAKDTAVLVVGAASGPEAEQLAKKRSLPFPLIAESTGDVYARYGLGKSLAFIQHSGTFLIDKQGRIVYMHTATNPATSLKKEELRAAIQRLG